jgi:signal transduction histidine kinase
MFSTARLRLTGWYLLILTIIVGLLSIGLYYLLLWEQDSAVTTAQSGLRYAIDQVFANDETTLAYQILALDAVVLLPAAIGAYILAGRTLRPIQEAMERQRRFAAAASHELRTPLTVLQGNLEVALLNPRTPEEYEQIIREAVQETEHMGHMVKDLVVLARDETEAGSLTLSPIALNDVARAAIERVEPLVHRKGQTLEVSLPDRLSIRGDALKLRQALMNLLENAVTYTPEGGSIRLVGRRERGKAVLEVRDTGPGIAPWQVPRLFEPFYQVNTARSDSGHVGLGLALAAWIVRAHGGQIDVASQAGLGSVFRLSLPSVS